MHADQTGLISREKILLSHAHVFHVGKTNQRNAQCKEKIGGGGGGGGDRKTKVWHVRDVKFWTGNREEGGISGKEGLGRGGEGEGGG